MCPDFGRRLCVSAEYHHSLQGTHTLKAVLLQWWSKHSMHAAGRKILEGPTDPFAVLIIVPDGRLLSSQIYLPPLRTSPWSLSRPHRASCWWPEQLDCAAHAWSQSDSTDQHRPTQCVEFCINCFFHLGLSQYQTFTKPFTFIVYYSFIFTMKALANDEVVHEVNHTLVFPFYIFHSTLFSLIFI